MNKRITRKIRIRARVTGTDVRPRVAIFRSNKNVYLQAIDDVKNETIAAASTLGDEKEVASRLAKNLQALKIKKIVFDRGGYKYHGKVKTIADELRKAGLEF